jgi:hypothetical protein
VVLLTGVHQHVFLQIASPSKSFVAHQAAVGLLTGVHQHVLLQIASKSFVYGSSMEAFSRRVRSGAQSSFRP